MTKQTSTEKLVEQFAVNPGIERDDLEFKSKEILDSTEGKKKVVRTLSAMANKRGGTMIIGVRRQSEGVLHQNFEKESEARQELTHIAQQYTNPPLSEHWTLDFEECFGNLLLRAEVEAASTDLIRFDYGGDYQIWVREEDGMREMTTGEIADFYKRQKEKRRESPPSFVQRTEHVELDPKPLNNLDLPDNFSERMITKVSPDYNVLFGRGLGAYRIGKSLTYYLQTGLPAQTGYVEFLDVLQSASEIIGIKTNRDLGYAIRVGEVELLGRTLSGLSHDISRLKKIDSELRELSECSWNYGPVISGYTPFEYGVFWFELQKETKSFTRGNIGLVLPDLPFDDSSIQSFYEEIGTNPHSYDHQHGLNFVSIKGRGGGHLARPKGIELSSENDVPLFVETDNPLYSWPIGLQKPIPERLTKGISSVTRIPFQVTGGHLPESSDRFYLKDLTFTEVSGIYPTVLVSALCSQQRD